MLIFFSDANEKQYKCNNCGGNHATTDYGRCRESNSKRSGEETRGWNRVVRSEPSVEKTDQTQQILNEITKTQNMIVNNNIQNIIFTKKMILATNPNAKEEELNEIIKSIYDESLIKEILKA